MTTVMLMTACSSRPSTQDVADKIMAREPLTEADYDVMADYVIDGYKELGEIAAEARTGKIETEAVVTRLIELNNGLEYQQQFVEAINRYAADPNADKYPAIDEKIDRIATMREQASVDIRSTSPTTRPADGSEPSATAAQSIQ